MTTLTAPTVGPARYVEHLMGMPVSLALRGRHARSAAGAAAWAEAVTELRWVDRVFSTWKPDSYVSRLGRGEIALAACPPEVGEVLALAEQAERESGGAFSAFLPQPGSEVGFDPTGVVKGWAVDRAARHLRRLEGTDFCLSAGGDMVCHTALPGSPPWTVGIEDPADPSRLIARVPVRNGAVATSGTAHRGSHLVDARTGLAPSGVASVTVVAPTLTWADIDATAAYALGRGAAAWLRARPGRTGLVVRSDGRTEVFGAPSAG